MYVRATVILVGVLAAGCSRQESSIGPEPFSSAKPSAGPSASLVASMLAAHRVGRIILDVDRLKKYSITSSDVVDRLTKGGVTVLGTRDVDYQGAKAIEIRFDPEAHAAETVSNLSIGKLDGLIVSLKDLAVVEIGSE